MIKIIIIFALLYPIAISGQTTTNTVTVKIKTSPFKKTIQDKSAYYVLFFDAEKFIESLTPDSVFDNSAEIAEKIHLKNPLVDYFAKHDTLILSVEIERQLNAFLDRLFFPYKTAAIARGELIIFNTKTKKLETELHAVTKKSVNETQVKTGNQTLTKTANQSELKIFSANYKHLFHSSSAEVFSEKVK